MSTDHSWVPDESGLPQDEFSDTVLIAEVDPSGAGADRAIVYPNDRPAGEVATRWLAVTTDLLIPVERVR